MRTARIFLSALALSIAAAPAIAGTTDQTPAPQTPQAVPADPQTLLDGQLDEFDVAFIFAWLKQAMIAASEGREVKVPALVQQKIEAMSKALKERGVDAGVAVLDNIQAQIQQLMRENPPPQQRPIEPPASVHL